MEPPPRDLPPLVLLPPLPESQKRIVAPAWRNWEHTPAWAKKGEKPWTFYGCHKIFVQDFESVPGDDNCRITCIILEKANPFKSDAEVILVRAKDGLDRRFMLRIPKRFYLNEFHGRPCWAWGRPSGKNEFYASLRFEEIFGDVPFDVKLEAEAIITLRRHLHRMSS